LYLHGSYFIMKKLFVAIFAFLYLAISGGVGLNMHYCMGKLDAVTLGQQKADKCGRCGMHTKNSAGCCHDSFQFVKLTDDQKPAMIAGQQFIPAIPVQPVSIYLTALPSQELSHSCSNNHSPPLRTTDRCVLLGVFRI
jgi:hypothetical protein